jgi:hypothetical protein
MDPDSESGSTQVIESGSIPDPQPWLLSKVLHPYQCISFVSVSMHCLFTQEWVYKLAHSVVEKPVLRIRTIFVRKLGSSHF